MKSFKQLREDLALSTGIGISNPELPMGRPKFAGLDVFDVDNSTFHKCRLGKLKFKHWKTFVGEDTNGQEIRQYARKSPKKSVVLRNSETGAMIFARGGLFDMFKKER